MECTCGQLGRQPDVTPAPRHFVTPGSGPAVGAAGKSGNTGNTGAAAGGAKYRASSTQILTSAFGGKTFESATTYLTGRDHYSKRRSTCRFSAIAVGGWVVNQIKIVASMLMRNKARAAATGEKLACITMTVALLPHSVVSRDHVFVCASTRTEYGVCKFV